MSYQSELKSWGTTGTEYPNDYNYEGGEQPDPSYDNFFADNVIKDIEHLVDQANDYESHKTQSHAHHERYADSEAVNAVESTSLNIDGDIDLTGSVDGVNLSSFYSSYDSHTSDNSAHHSRYSDSEAVSAIESTTLSALDVDGSNSVRSTEGFILSHGSPSEERARFVYDDSAIDTFHDGSHKYRFEDLHNGNTIFAADNGSGPIDFQAEIQQNGNRVATRNWTNSNFNNYTDSEARSAVEGSTLNAQLTLNHNDASIIRMENDENGGESRFRQRSADDSGNYLHSDIGLYAEGGYWGVKVPYSNTEGSGYKLKVHESGRVDIPDHLNIPVYASEPEGQTGDIALIDGELKVYE